MNSAEDSSLPWHWRCMCIDFACRPLARLATLAGGARARHRRLVAMARRLACAELACMPPPALPPPAALTA